MKKSKTTKKKASPAPKKKMVKPKIANPKMINLKTVNQKTAGTDFSKMMPLVPFILISAVMVSAFALIMMVPLLQSHSGFWNSDAPSLRNAKNQVTSFVLSAPNKAIATASILETKLSEKLHIRLPFQTRPVGMTGYEAPPAETNLEPSTSAN